MNEDRRNFLKFIFFGALVLSLGRVFSFLKLKDESSEGRIGENFRASEENGKLVFANRKGEKVFTINDSGEMEIGN